MFPHHGFGRLLYCRMSMDSAGISIEALTISHDVNGLMCVRIVNPCSLTGFVTHTDCLNMAEYIRLIDHCCCSQGSVWGSGLAGTLCALAVLLTGSLQPWQVGFVASFASKLSDTVSSEIGKVSPYKCRQLNPSGHPMTALMLVQNICREGPVVHLTESRKLLCFPGAVINAACMHICVIGNHLLNHDSSESGHGSAGIWAHNLPRHNTAESAQGHGGSSQCGGHSSWRDCGDFILWTCTSCGTGLIPSPTLASPVSGERMTNCRKDHQLGDPVN